MGGDIIKLSVKEHRFGKEKDSLVVTTEGDYWWMMDYVRTNNVLDTVRVTKHDSIYGASELQSRWFRVTREATKKLLVQVDANDSGVERWFDLTLEADDYFGSLKIIQSAE
jgi:hypothetical protein